MQKSHAFVIGIAVAMGVGTVAGAVIGTSFDNLALWTGLGPAIGLGLAIGPITARAQRKQ